MFNQHYWLCFHTDRWPFSLTHFRIRKYALHCTDINGFDQITYNNNDDDDDVTLFSFDQKAFPLLPCRLVCVSSKSNKTKITIKIKITFHVLNQKKNHHLTYNIYLLDYKTERLKTIEEAFCLPKQPRLLGSVGRCWWHSDARCLPNFVAIPEKYWLIMQAKSWFYAKNKIKTKSRTKKRTQTQVEIDLKLKKIPVDIDAHKTTAVAFDFWVVRRLHLAKNNNKK
jgi:hypothetical protein